LQILKGNQSRKANQSRQATQRGGLGKLWCAPQFNQAYQINVEEREALADAKLAPSSQARLDQLLAEYSQRQLSGDEAKVLDQLLAKIDELTILKTRARYTLKQQAEATRQ